MAKFNRFVAKTWRKELMQFLVTFISKVFPTLNPLSLYKILVIVGQKEIQFTTGMSSTVFKTNDIYWKKNGFIMKK